MTQLEADAERPGFYKPLPVLLEGIRSRFKTTPWDNLDLELSTARMRYLNPTQLAPIEAQLSVPGYAPRYPQAPGPEHYKVLDNHSRGFLSGIEVNIGAVELLAGKPDGSEVVQAALIQYVHNPREVVDRYGNSEVDRKGNPLVDNDGVVNVVILRNGEIHSSAMIPNGEPIVRSFNHPASGKNTLSYPDNEPDAVAMIKQDLSTIDAEFLPLLAKMGILTAAAADVCLDRTRNNSASLVQLLQFKGANNIYEITKEGIDPRLAEILGIRPNEHPLSGLLDPKLIPSRSKVVEVDNYTDLIGLLVNGRYKLPTFFRSHELGMYYSENSPFDDESAAKGVREVLGYNGILDKEGVPETGIVVPSKWPGNYRDSWKSRLAFIKHQLALQTYEELPGWLRGAYLGVCMENSDQTAHLRNATYLNIEITGKEFPKPNTPEASTFAPFSFKDYTARQQHRIAGGFMAGALTLNKPVFPYSRGPHLHGDGTHQKDWAPKSVGEFLDDHGIKTSEAPESKIYPYDVRGITPDGEVEKRYIPISIVKALPVPPIEHLHRDLEEVYGIKLTFPKSLPEGETNVTDFVPLSGNLFESAIMNVAAALEKYPPGYTQGLKLAEMRVAERVALVDPNPVNPASPIKWLAVPDKDLIYYGFQNPKPLHERSSKETIHHALRLIADKAFGVADDEEWAALHGNGKGAYTRLSYWEMQQKHIYDATTPRGFSTYRAQTSPAEDRAFIADQIFGNFASFRSELRRSTFRRDENEVLRKIIKEDKNVILLDKISLLLQIYEKESGGAMFPGWSEKLPDYVYPLLNFPNHSELLSRGYRLHPKAYARFLENSGTLE